MRATYILSHREARRNAASAVMDAPEGYVVQIKPKTRSLEQNAKLHSMICDVASQKEWAGRRWDSEVWKRLLTAAWLRARGEGVTVIPALDGHGVDVVFRRTSTLSIAECSDLIEFISAWSVHNEVNLAGASE